MERVILDAFLFPFARLPVRTVHTSYANWFPFLEHDLKSVAIVGCKNRS